MKTEKIEKLIKEIDDITCPSDKKCYYDDCKDHPVINSHTLPRGNFKYLDEIGNLVMIESSMITTMQNKRVMKKFDSKNFSTFSGFCDTHDHKLFQLIDAYDGIMNQEKATLVHYRNICYGVSHVQTQLRRLDHLSKQNYSDSGATLITSDIDELAKEINAGLNGLLG